jgi:CheY-like chemotaxis protein
MPYCPTLLTSADVLVVDEDLGTRLLVERLMEPHCHVHTAADYAAFQSVIRGSASVDLVLADMVLGKERSGSDVLEATEKHASDAAIPVVALTACMRPGGRTHYLAMGFDGCVSKPFTRKMLFRELERSLIESHRSVC